MPSARAASSISASRAAWPGVQPTPRYAVDWHLFVNGVSTS